jgi:Zn-dependent protease with chaperone function
MKLVTVVTCIIVLAIGCTAGKNTIVGVPAYVPESKELYDTIARMDSLFFSAYDRCDTTLMRFMFSRNIEFYHDRGGLETSQDNIMESTKKYICGKVSRQLLKGSIEVYPVPNFGAIEMGAHRFFNNQEKEAGPSRYSKFVHVWKREDDGWKLSRVISLH